MLADRYRLAHRIAVGGMGEVWEALDTRLGRQVAVKVLKAELSGDPEFAHRFRAEARTTASLNHPGIAAVHDYGETATTVGGPADTAFLVMELVSGQPLSAIIADRGRLTADKTLDILEQAGDALQAAHQRGLVHRDVKPGNILVTPTGTVKLTDFGIAKAVDAAPVTRTGMVMGTAHYISPEQASGTDAGPASDVYSLGVVGYECLAGQRPFQADSTVTVAMMHIRDAPPPLPPDVPNGARSLIEATMIKDPKQRYATGGELARAVGAVRAGKPLPPPTGMAGATEQLSGSHPTTASPRTALLPPGSFTSGQTGYQQTGYQPTGYRQASRDDRPPDEDRRSRGGATRWVFGALLLLAVLALGAWGLSEALQGTDPSAEGQAPGGVTEPTEPTDEEQQQPAEQAPEEPTTEEPTTTTTESETVTVNEIDYLGDSGEEAAAELEDLGLDPTVVDGEGEELDGDDQEECLVSAVEPTGDVEPGSAITVTCLGSS
ncbi:MAG: protein kinase [Pseudonocardiaceae bacterium]|nr:protein kinase [Pseudonocardiaceae bacterium]